MSGWTRVDSKRLGPGNLGGKRVVGGLERSLEAVILQVDYRYRRHQAFTFLEEFVVRCLVDLTPLPSDGEIAEILGLGSPQFVEPITKELEGSELLRRTNGKRAVTSELRTASKRRGFQQEEHGHSRICWTPALGVFEPYKGNAEVDDAVSVRPRVREATLEWIRSQRPFSEMEELTVKKEGVRKLGAVSRKVMVRVMEGPNAEGVHWESFDPLTLTPAPEWEEGLRSLDVDKEARNLIAYSGAKSSRAH